MNRIILIILVAVSLKVYGQSTKLDNSSLHDQIHQCFHLRNTNLDSALVLWHEVEKTINLKPNQADLAYFYQIGSHLYRLKSNYKLSFKFAFESVNLYTQLNDKMGISMAYFEVGNSHMNQFNLDSARYYFQKSLEIKKDIKDKEGIGIALANLGVVEDYTGNYSKASELYYNSIILNQEVGNITQVADTYHNLSIVQYNIGQIDKAIEYQNQAIKYNKELKNYISESMNHVCLSAFYLEKNEVLKAEEHGMISEKLCKEQKYNRGLLYAQSALGDVYLTTKKYDKALMHFDSFLKNINAEGDQYMEAQVLQKKAKVLLETNKNGAAFPLLKRALEIFLKNGTTKELKEVYENLSSYYHNIGNDAKAYSFLTEANTYRDSLFKEEKNKEILNLEIKFDVKQKEIENKALSLEKELSVRKTNQLQWGLGFGGIGLGLLSVFAYFLYMQRNQQKFLNKQLVNSSNQIQLLHQELNHRVKNNLSFMTSLVEMQGRRTQNMEAREILKETENRLGALSLVHSNLFKNDEATTVNLAFYLEELVSQLEKIFAIPDKELNFICHFTDHNVNAEDAMRLGLIVNELVTNSVKHAFQNVQEPQIHITTDINKTGKLTLSYKDNGPGHTHMSNLTAEQSHAHLGTKLISLLRDQMKDRYTLVC
jgi:two-component system, sensor histidine kinase PdtaS